MDKSFLNDLTTWVSRSARTLGAIALFLLLTGCSLPQVSAEDRLFLDLSLEYVGAYELPKVEFEGTPVRGLSALTYDRERDRFYVLSDDRSEAAPARFYTVKLSLDQENPDQLALEGVEIEAVTFLQDETGNPFPAHGIDPEGITLSPRQSVFVASEGAANEGLLPFVDEFELQTGRWLKRLPVPERYLPQVVDDQLQGVQDNRGFEALTLSAAGLHSGEPFRVFVGIEEPLQQDPAPPEQGQPLSGRFLHYVVGDNQAMLIAEHLYPIEPRPFGAAMNGLVELAALDQGGHFLSMERAFGLLGNTVRIFQLALGGATDTSTLPEFSPDTSAIAPIQKRLLLDLTDLEIRLDNLEGMALGPRLRDGSRSLLLVSDDNFNEVQVTQFLLFKLRGVQ